MRRLFTILLMVAAMAVSAQTPAQMQKQIAAAAQKLRTMDCDFIQTKHLKMLNEKMVSTGTMRYQRTDKLRWEYTKPYKYTFVMNGQKVMITKGGRTDVINTAENKIFREVARIMVGTMTGSSISSAKDFKAAYQVKGGEWIVTLTPQRKDMKRMFKTIQLTYNVQQAIVTRVVLTEVSGGVTDIELKNIKTNGNISQSTFAVR